MPNEIYGERYKFLSRDAVLSYEEIIRVAKIFVQLGVTRLRLTGGEPLLRPNIEELVRDLAAISGVDDLSLTTNGYRLGKIAGKLKRAGLKRLTVSLDTLDDEIFQRMNGRQYGTQPILDGIQAAEEAGFMPIKINTVVQKGVNDHTVVELASYFKARGHIVRFIEYMDVGNRNGWRMEQVVSSKDILHQLNEEMPLVALSKNFPGEVAARYRYADGEGELGLISSVTNPFCMDCSRARLSADGIIYTCLFASFGHDLRTLIRSQTTDGDIVKFITRVWSAREDRYSEERGAHSKQPAKKVEMYHIGG
ncbi:MAG: cyclic pyranopterin phosphate synthase [Chloroflexi bacterium]|jgi:cyclic pyranopterin phosphate synthase|nr:MAG: cyclic pyranopterin phosphate synthase [Chloroflexota bacterium]